MYLEFSAYWWRNLVKSLAFEYIVLLAHYIIKVNSSTVQNIYFFFVFENKKSKLNFYRLRFIWNNKIPVKFLLLNRFTYQFIVGLGKPNAAQSKNCMKKNWIYFYCGTFCIQETLPNVKSFPSTTLTKSALVCSVRKFCWFWLS